jgi:hypothetical protein
VIRSPRKVLHLENKSSAYTPKGAGSVLVIGSAGVAELQIRSEEKAMVIADGAHAELLKILDEIRDTF